MIDMEQARILDFGKKGEEQKVIANIKQTLINLKAVAEDHAKRLFDMKVENERIAEENEKLKAIYDAASPLLGEQSMSEFEETVGRIREAREAAQL